MFARWHLRSADWCTSQWWRRRSPHRSFHRPNPLQCTAYLWNYNAEAAPLPWRSWWCSCLQELRCPKRLSGRRYHRTHLRSHSLAHKALKESYINASFSPFNVKDCYYTDPSPSWSGWMKMNTFHHCRWQWRCIFFRRAGRWCYSCSPCCWCKWAEPRLPLLRSLCKHLWADGSARQSEHGWCRSLWMSRCCLEDKNLTAQKRI